MIFNLNISYGIHHFLLRIEQSSVFIFSNNKVSIWGLLLCLIYLSIYHCAQQSTTHVKSAKIFSIEKPLHIGYTYSESPDYGKIMRQNIE